MPQQIVNNLMENFIMSSIHATSIVKMIILFDLSLSAFLSFRMLYKYQIVLSINQYKWQANKYWNELRFLDLPGPPDLFEFRPLPC